MRPDEIEGDQVAHPLVELGGASEVSEQERQTGDLEALIDVDHVGAIEIAKYLVGQQPLCAEEGFAPAQQLIEPFRRYPQPWQHAGVSAVFEREAQRPRAQLDRLGRRAHPVEKQRKALALAGRLALDLDELGHVGHRVEKDHQLGRQLQRKQGLPAGRKLDRVESYLLDHLSEIVRQIDRRAPEDLAKIFRERQLVRIMRRYPADPPVDGERHLDDLVEDRLITRRTPGAMVFLAVHAPQRRGRIEHARHSSGTAHSMRARRGPGARRAERRLSISLRRELSCAAKSNTLIRQRSRSGASRTSFSIASTIPGSADCRKSGNRFLASLILNPIPHRCAEDPGRPRKSHGSLCRSDAIAFARPPPCRRHSKVKFGYELRARQLPCCHHAVSIVGRQRLMRPRRSAFSDHSDPAAHA